MPKKAVTKEKTEEPKAPETDSPTVQSPKAAKSTHAATSMEELLAGTGYTLKGLRKGDVVEGLITRISSREIAIDTGSKTEGVVMDKEIETYKDMLSKLKVGDKVVAQVIVAENDRGQSVLSIRKSLLDKRWTQLSDIQKSGEAVEVVLREPVRGGVLVDYGGLRGYIPLSQVDSTLSKQLDKSIQARSNSYATVTGVLVETIVSVNAFRGMIKQVLSTASCSAYRATPKGLPPSLAICSASVALSVLSAS